MSEDAANEHVVDDAQVLLGEGEEDVAETPRLETPVVAVQVTTPSTAVKDVEPLGGYFAQNPAQEEQWRQAGIATNGQPLPSVSTSEATAEGQLFSPKTIDTAALAAERPEAHTQISAFSIQSNDSTATVRPKVVSTQPRPAYPDQSYAALHHQHYPTRHVPPTLRQRSSHPGQIFTFASALASSHQSGSRTAGNSPAVTPGGGLFNLQSSAPPTTQQHDPPLTPGLYASPFLHFTQMVQPKETHVADVDVDPVSGRKLINHYEVIDELGRGTHGKVKLGRDLHTEDNFVAIKIVERFSKRRKLGKLGTKEDKVKKEVAILKKARHPNVVALLEVIDDPSRKKVYIVLEWVERGEIHWRAKAPREIAVVEARRYERERAGKADPRAKAEDTALLAEATKRLAKVKRRQQRTFRRVRRDGGPAAWSIEMGDSESDVSDDDRLSYVSSTTVGSTTNKPLFNEERRGSRVPSPLTPHMEEATTPTNETRDQYLSLTSEPQTLSPTITKKDIESVVPTGLEGTMYGAYDYNSRSGSLANSLHSSMSSRAGSKDSLSQMASETLDAGLDPDLEYVPVMTLQQTRVALRDTVLGLQYLHYQGIIHRDIKPPNLLATKDGRVKISDFGVSYLGRPIHEDDAGENVSEHEAQDLDEEAKELAKTVGTPAFYAPELCQTDYMEDAPPITKAIDVWALGITLFCMLYARTPFVDNEFVVMRQIAEENIHIPRRRLQPVNSKPSSRPSSHGRSFAPTPTGRRQEFDLVYEDIGEDLHDLLKRLLIKDPKKRITLEEVRHHPWLVADLADKVQWLEETDPGRSNQGKKIEISSEDVNAAVVPLQFLDRVRSGIRKVGERLGLGASKSTTRGRSQSNVGTGSGANSAGSSTTNVTQEGRRQSLRGDESIIPALKASRNEGDHPLSKSVAASPDLESEEKDFGSIDTRPESAMATVKRARDITPPRPYMPERATTVTSGSMRTLRQSDFRRSHGEESPPPSPGLPGTPTAVDVNGSAGAWGSGVARRILRTVRERSSARSSTSRDASRERGTSVGSDAHGEPSLALSQTTAAGHVNLPAALDEPAPRSVTSSAHNSPVASRPQSLAGSPSNDRLFPGSSADTGRLSRTSSNNSVASVGRRALNMFSRSPSRHQPPPGQSETSTTEGWHKAENEHIRKRIQEEQEAHERPMSPYVDRTCPPSPDDQRAKGRDSRRMSTLDISNPDSSLETSPTAHDGRPPLVSSTSDFGSAASMSISNPSIPSVISEASSVDATDQPLSRPESEKDLMSSGDTIHDRPLPSQQQQQQQQYRDEPLDEGYTADPGSAVNSDEDDYDSSSDSDGGLVMSRRKSVPKSSPPAASSSPEKSRRGTGVSARSRKSSRSGSSNTMKKISADETEDDGDAERLQEQQR